MNGEVGKIMDSAQAYLQLKELVRNALYGMGGVSVDLNGFYYSECYKDYRDDLSDETIVEILKAEHPRDYFVDELMNAYLDAMSEVENGVLDDLKKNQDIVRALESFNLDEDDLRECLRDVWYVNPPYDDFLKQEVCMDVMLDTGDCNYEFTKNNLASTYIETVEDFEDESSLLWLCEQQGITREELLAAFDKGTAHSDEVCGLQQRSRELIVDLQAFGFILPRFAESVIHTGAYREYVKLQDAMDKAQADIALLRTKLGQNDISYQEYLKKHFDRFERLDPMSEEQFEAKQADVLAKLNEKLEMANTAFAQAKDQLDFHTDYRKIAILQAEYKDVQRQLSELAKTDEYKKAEFINSVHNECVNASNVGVVTFLVKMTLDEAIRLTEVINGEHELNNSYYYEERTGSSSIVIGKDVRCGLMDDCSGGGSVFELKLLKDVEVPVKALYRAVPDRGNGNYGFMEIYGADEEFFRPSLNEIREVRQPLVQELIAGANDRLPVENAVETVEKAPELG